MDRYDKPTIWLHWITVVLVVLLWVLGETADWAPRGPSRTALWSVHFIAGFLLGFVLLTRVAWRAEFGKVLPPADHGPVHWAAKVTHWSLYILLGLAVLTGIANALYRGSNMFGLFSLPRIGTGDAAMRRTISGWHELAANLTVAVALLHAVAAMVHQYVWRDELFERMRP
jgi:cytochrome b561